jgi:hypothetical protein
VCEGECEEDPTAAGGVGLDINRSFSKSSNVIALGVVFCCGLGGGRISDELHIFEVSKLTSATVGLLLSHKSLIVKLSNFDNNLFGGSFSFFWSSF